MLLLTTRVLYRPCLSPIGLWYLSILIGHLIAFSCGTHHSTPCKIWALRGSVVDCSLLRSRSVVSSCALQFVMMVTAISPVLPLDSPEPREEQPVPLLLLIRFVASPESEHLDSCGFLPSFPVFLPIPALRDPLSHRSVYRFSGSVPQGNLLHTCTPLPPWFAILGFDALADGTSGTLSH